MTSRQLQGDGIDQHLAYVQSSNAYWYLTDHLGSTRAVVDNSLAVQDSLVYDAYGNITYQTPTPSTTPLYAWDGYDHDAATGYYDDKARVYDPASGRWISQDPMGFDAGDSNLYRYVHNQPTIDRDPSGLWNETIRTPYGPVRFTTTIVKDQVTIGLGSEAEKVIPASVRFNDGEKTALIQVDGYKDGQVKYQNKWIVPRLLARYGVDMRAVLTDPDSKDFYFVQLVASGTMILKADGGELLAGGEKAEWKVDGAGQHLKNLPLSYPVQKWADDGKSLQMDDLPGIEIKSNANVTYKWDPAREQLGITYDGDPLSGARPESISYPLTVSSKSLFSILPILS